MEACNNKSSIEFEWKKLDNVHSEQEQAIQVPSYQTIG